MTIFACVFNRKERNKRMIYIANPIYDVVFKYLMDDERIARTILSALLRMDITHIEVRPHEYPNSQRDTLSVFRIDFAATVREDDGSTHLVLIELQKTWLETETLRFRQYLGVQYQNPKNMDSDGNGLPMIAVYLLGHRVGDIEEPVLYVRHEAQDRDGQVVTKGLPDPFVDSLTHNSIIVQIPRLRGRILRRLLAGSISLGRNLEHYCIPADIFCMAYSLVFSLFFPSFASVLSLLSLSLLATSS